MSARAPARHTRLRAVSEPITTPTAAARRLPDDEELLVRAGELVIRGWCRHGLAEDSRGREVEPWSRNAARWSPLGALTKVWLETQEERAESFEVAYASLALATGGRLEEWNGARWRTKWHVLGAFARAREYLPQARREVRARR
jgi:hypothetical protein